MRAALPPSTDNSIKFARWRQCAFRLTHDSLGLYKSARQMAFWSVQPFCRSRLYV